MLKISNEVLEELLSDMPKLGDQIVDEMGFKEDEIDLTEVSKVAKVIIVLRLKGFRCKGVYKQLALYIQLKNMVVGTV